MSRRYLCAMLIAISFSVETSGQIPEGFVSVKPNKMAAFTGCPRTWSSNTRPGQPALSMGR